MRKILYISLLVGLASCGGAKKGSVYASGGKNAPPPPPEVKSTNDVAAPGQPATAKVEVSADAKKDYQAAMDSFRSRDKDGKWGESDCKSSADAFAAVVREHADL